MKALKTIGTVLIAIGIGIIAGGTLSYGHQLKEPTATPVASATPTPTVSTATATPVGSTSTLLNQGAN